MKTICKYLFIKNQKLIAIKLSLCFIVLILSTIINDYLLGTGKMLFSIFSPFFYFLWASAFPNNYINSNKSGFSQFIASTPIGIKKYFICLYCNSFLLNVITLTINVVGSMLLENLTMANIFNELFVFLLSIILLLICAPLTVLFNNYNFYFAIYIIVYLLFYQMFKTNAIITEITIVILTIFIPVLVYISISISIVIWKRR